MKVDKNKQKTIAIFGSTGSIGKNVIDVVKNNREKFKIKILVAQNNFKLLAKQALDFNPEYVVIEDQSKYLELKELLKSLKKTEILCSQQAVIDVAKIHCDLFVNAIVGIAGMIPTFNAIKAKSNIALANKEAIVCAGSLMTQEAKKNNVTIFPIDSEHNAIFQIFEKQNLSLIEDIVLTASGGPFFFSKKNFREITVQEALKHPKWQMGSKISIDSATMMNKGLEMIEAYYFFGIAKEKIKIIVHPQSIIHGIVNYQDGASLAMMSQPDMRVPISYALNYPNRLAIKHQKLDLEQVKKLEFYQVDEKKFPTVKLCKDALKLEGSALVALNCANEIAVAKFLKGMIRFDEIYLKVAKTLEKINNSQLKNIDDVIYFDNLARQIASSI